MEDAGPMQAASYGIPLEGTKAMRESVVSKLDRDIDAVFAAIDDLRTELTPYLGEPGPDIAMAPGPSEQPRSQLEMSAVRIPVIVSQIRELTSRVIP